MRRTFLLTLALASALFLSTRGMAQACPFNTAPVPNDTSTGTTLNKAAKLTSTGQAVVMQTTDTTGYAGLVVANAGTSGLACLAISGAWPMVVDGSTTVRHYIQISSSVGGDGHDTGSTTYPASGGDVLGFVQSASTGSGSTSLVYLFPPEINPVSGSLAGPGTTVVNDLMFWNNTSGTLAGDDGASGPTVTNHTLHAANSFFSTSYSTNSVSGTTISGLTSPTIAANSTIHFRCDGLWSSSSTTAGMALAITASQTPQSIWYGTAIANNVTTGPKETNSVTNGTLLSGANAFATSTNYNFEIYGAIQWNAGTPGTFSLQAATTSVAGTVTVVAGASCSILP